MSKVRTVLVTGAAGALGRETLAVFAAKGWKCVAGVRDEREREALRKFTSERGVSAAVLVANLAREEETRRLVSEAGEVDAAVNVAGAFEMFRTVDADPAKVAALFDANFTGNWLLMKHLLPGMAKRKFGRIVLVSAAATLGPAGASMGFYVASKSALNALVQSTAQEMAEHDIRINAVMPTIMDTPRNRADMPDADFSKWLKTSDVAEEIAKLFAQKAPNGTLVKLG